jgi:hypothetical protein
LLFGIIAGGIRRAAADRPKSLNHRRIETSDSRESGDAGYGPTCALYCDMRKLPLVRRRFSTSWLTVTVLAIGGPLVPAVAGDPTVTIRLRDGRRAEGSIVAAPDDRGLQITSSGPGVVVRSRFAWDDLASVAVDGRAMTAEEILRWAGERRWAEAPRPQPVRTKVRTEGAKAPIVADEVPRRVESLVVAAEPAQWNADALPDGLLVRVAPRDADGRLVPVRGEVTLVLRGFRHGHFYRDSHRLEPKPIVLETVRAVVSEADFADGPAAVRLPFAPDRTDRDYTVEPTCLLSARLGVPTQGVFEAVSPVLIRPWDPLVDRLPYFEGRTDPFRMLPAEAIGRPIFRD